jgi:hypothetical protein
MVKNYEYKGVSEQMKTQVIETNIFNSFKFMAEGNIVRGSVFSPKNLRINEVFSRYSAQTF